MEIDNLPASNDELDTLWQVAHTVERTIKPVTPPPAFRAHLREDLQLAARHQRVPLPAPQRALPWVVLLVAAILGAGIGFAVIQLRARRIAQHRLSM